MEINEKKDDCYRKVKSRYKTWPSAYASGALVKCRRVGAKNWGNSVKEGEDITEKEKLTSKPSSENSLHDWFRRKGGKGSSSGWVDCNSPDGKGGYKSCGRSDGEDRNKYPACRPTPSACKKDKKTKGESWGKKSKMTVKESIKISKELKFHIDNNISLSENVFRIYSDKFFDLVNEVRSLYEKDLIKLNEEDTWLAESDLGKKVILENGKEVYLDAPIYDDENEDERELRESLGLDEEHSVKIIKKMGSMRYFSITFDGITKLFLSGKVFNLLLITYHRYIKVVGTPHFKRFLDLDFDYFIFFSKNKPYIFKKNLDKIYTDEVDSYGRDSFVFKESPVRFSEFDSIVFKPEESLNEAKHRGKNVKLNSPFRTPGGPKKFAVYVKTPKGTVKKVTFGDPNLRIKNSNKGRAKSFRARHHCDQKRDRTTAGYWSCNVSRYRKKLGLKSSNSW